jgi:hypothetical protein
MDISGNKENNGTNVETGSTGRGKGWGIYEAGC